MVIDDECTPHRAPRIDEPFEPLGNIIARWRVRDLIDVKLENVSASARTSPFYGASCKFCGSRLRTKPGASPLFARALVVVGAETATARRTIGGAAAGAERRRRARAGGGIPREAAPVPAARAPVAPRETHTCV